MMKSRLSASVKAKRARYSNPQKQPDALARLIRHLIDQQEETTQAAFAELLSRSSAPCTQAGVCTWVTGSRCVSSAHLTRLATLQGVSTDQAATDFVLVAALSNLRRSLERDERCGERYKTMCHRLQVAAWNAMVEPANRLGIDLKREKPRGRPKGHSN